MTISLRAKALLRALASLDSIRPAVELEKLIYSEAAKRGLAVHFDLPADDDGRAA